MSKFSDDKNLCNVRVYISKTEFEGVLSKSIDSSSKGSKILLSEVLGWVSDISVKVLADVIRTSFHLVHETNQYLEQLFC